MPWLDKMEWNADEIGATIPDSGAAQKTYAVEIDLADTNLPATWLDDWKAVLALLRSNVAWPPISLSQAQMETILAAQVERTGQTHEERFIRTWATDDWITFPGAIFGRLPLSVPSWIIVGGTLTYTASGWRFTFKLAPAFNTGDPTIDQVQADPDFDNPTFEQTDPTLTFAEICKITIGG